LYPRWHIEVVVAHTERVRERERERERRERQPLRLGKIIALFALF
jgi:hypothetical protein